MVGHLTGAQKAAIILMSLGEDISSNVLKHLSHNEVRMVVDEITHLDYVDSATRNDVIREFYELFSEDTLIGGEEKAGVLLGRVFDTGMRESVRGPVGIQEKDAIEILKSADAFAILEAIKNDQPQTIATILRYISPVKSSRVLRDLEPGIREEVIKRMASMGNPSTEIIEGIAQTLKPKLMLASSKDEIRRSSGIGIASTIVSYIGGEDAREILKAIEKEDPDTAAKMKELIFTFDDLAGLDDRSIQRVLREVDRHDVVVAFKAASDEIKNKVLSNMSERAREEFMEDFETLGPVRLADVEEAQRKIVEVVRRLDMEGVITARGGEVV